MIYTIYFPQLKFAIEGEHFHCANFHEIHNHVMNFGKHLLSRILSESRLNVWQISVNYIYALK